MADATSEIELALFAPYNEQVDLLGSWTDYQPQPMRHDPDGWWRLAVPLADGKHLYSFRVKSRSYFCEGELVETFDPYAFSITQDAAQRAILNVKDGKRCWVDFEWQHDEKPLPQNDELTIYEMHVGDFTASPASGVAPELRGTFRGAIERLDYLQDLGINTIELMPVKEFPGNSWGYNLRSLFAVENSYGSPEDLCALIDACHGRGMRVLVDGVYNHAESESPLTKIDYDYWFYNPNPDPDYLQWGPKYNYEKWDENLKLFPARKYVIESIQYWVREFHIDGIRFDATYAIRKFDVMREFSDAAFGQIDGRKPFITVAEHVPQDPAIVGYPQRGPMCAAWHAALAARLRALLLGQEDEGQQPDDLPGLIKAIDPKQNGFESGQCVVNYVTSHDQAAMMRQLGEKSHIFDEPAFRRARLGAAIVMTVPGLPLIWMGMEFGQASEKSLDPRPLEWALLQNQSNRALHDFNRTLLRVRRETPALRTDNIQVLLQDGQRKILVLKRWNDAGNVAVVALNLRDEPSGEYVATDLSLPDGMWHDEVSGTQSSVSGGTLRGTLDRCGVAVFVKK